ncbi:MAG: DUF4097 domain-containing protein [Caldiserica bacterium]|jgi:DUF4097 and DUF4098 domain-containing protein YvlB|nr:DUF4097 domain-containing protein [Caldisericota bacterium]MDH7562053.1 DUF4097 family beta strand repeat-containing protein [Caldisericota bacterium]
MDRIESVFSLKRGARVAIRLSSADVFIKGAEGDQARVIVLKRKPESILPVIEASEDELLIRSGEKKAGEEWDSKADRNLGRDLWDTIWGAVSSSLREVGISLSVDIEKRVKDEVDLEILLPRGTILDFLTASGDLTVQDWEGEILFRSSSGDCKLRNVKGEGKMRTSSGDVRVEDFEGPLSINSTSGDVNLDEIKGELRVETVSGDVTLGKVKGDGSFSLISGDLRVEEIEGQLKASTTSGDLQAKVINSPSLKVSTVSGDLSLSLIPVSGGKYELATTSGDIILRVPPSARMEVKIATLSGSFFSNLNLSSEKVFEEKIDEGQKSGPIWLEKDWIRVGHKFTGVLNEKDAMLEIKTISGDITLRPLS